MEGEGREKRKAAQGSTENVSQRTKPIGLAAEFSREIFDLVCACNMASRIGYGEVVWFGYNVSDKMWTSKEGFAGFGSQGVAFTKGGARSLQMSMSSRTPKLFDMWLKEMLGQDFTHPAKAYCSNLAGSCYISPPLGRLLRARDGDRWEGEDSAISLRGVLGARGIRWSRSPNG